MKVQFICHPRCSTCDKARKWLDDKGISYEVRDIRNPNPTEEELRKWVEQSQLPLKKFFNTSGAIYRGLELAKKLPEMGEDEQFELLASDGMIVKRPILLVEDKILVGFKESEWEALFT
ncbi:MAG: arsenate reductase family protein [Clostridiales bacterium]|jgi:arsenate reductase|nr:arsenate reductase family protein [Clostridiales bacterium]